MKRPAFNALLDLAAALLFIAMAATGLLLQVILPPGSGRSWTLWSLERHDWAAIHTWTSLALLAVLVVHVAIHWKWIASTVGRRFTERHLSPRTLAVVASLGVVLSFAAFGAAAYLSREPRASLDACAPTDAAAEPGAPAPLYSQDVAPLLTARCVGCHNAGRATGGVRLDGYEAARSLVTPGDAAGSRLLAPLRTPRDAAHTLAPAHLLLLERWIHDGAAR